MFWLRTVFAASTKFSLVLATHWPWCVRSTPPPHQRTWMWHFLPSPDSAVHRDTVKHCVAWTLALLSRDSWQALSQHVLPGKKGQIPLASLGCWMWPSAIFLPRWRPLKTSCFPSFRVWGCVTSWGQCHHLHCKGWGRTSYFWQDHLWPTEAEEREPRVLGKTQTQDWDE